MIDVIGYTILLAMLIADYFIGKSAIKSYKRMKKAKEKAKFWRAI